MSIAPTRRIVTGHDAAGRAIIQEHGPVPRMQRIGGSSVPMFHEVWNTCATSVPIDYRITKAGIVPLARNLAAKFGPQGGRTNAIAPD